MNHSTLIANNRLIANLNGPWGSSDSPLMQPPWKNPAITSAGASKLFGTPAAWHNKLLTHHHHFVDPIQQIRSLKILSGGSFLATELHHKTYDGKAELATQWLQLPLSFTPAISLT